MASVSAGDGERDATIRASLDPDACSLQLERILGSADFIGSDRHRRFLAYVVRETLAGRAQRIKAYSIATEVLLRDASFDPRSDPIVRVEAGHLRRALERYYLSAGQQDPIEITMPKGGYVPLFTERATAPRSDAPPPPAVLPRSPVRRPVWFWGGVVVVLLALAAGGVGWSSRARLPVQPAIPRLLVQPFDDLRRSDASAAVARGLTQEVVSQITRFKEITVVAARSVGDSASVGGAPPRYTLEGSVDLDAHAIRFQAQLIRQSDDTVLWADSYTGDLTVSGVIEIERDIARQVATTLAQTYGVIFQADASRHVENPPEDWKSYSCTLTYYAYRATLDSATHPKVRKCLEEAVARFPDYATAWALLSQTYIDEARFGFAPDPAAGPTSVDRAIAAARRAVALDPTNTRGLQAEMLALYFTGDVEAALSVGRQALTLNPNDSELMGEYGFRLALAGEWSAGCPLIRKARDLNPGPLGYYEAALALCAYISGDLQKAVMWVRKTSAPDNPMYHLIAAAVFGEADDVPSAAAEVQWLQTHAPRIVADPRAVIAGRVRRAADVERLIGSLRKAGMTIDGS